MNDDKQYDWDVSVDFAVYVYNSAWIEPAGYDNFLLEREDTNGEPERFIEHESFIVTYHYPTTVLERIATDRVSQLENEDASKRRAISTTRAAERAAWKFDDGGDEIRPDTTCWNTIYDPHGLVANEAAQMQAMDDDRYPRTNMAIYSMPTESWKTVDLEKACNRLLARTAETHDRRSVAQVDRQPDSRTIHEVGDDEAR
ncbi:unnamed protein product [Phytophthora fragariaefolia]|uniref:Unnamed protein product n=1 Tax=Phytophthora fragariaefolia TaxID=1490495 RepID=A0A9W6XME7_9STRA|nr:unnamed protein product [Phytophthora fragariaefolia]